jgi:(R)-2-hydroxyacyl-CoA dehydratese activating ATPase
VSSAVSRLVAGIDIGSATTKVVLMKSGEVAGVSIMATGAGSRRAGERALGAALAQAGAEKPELGFIVATGYGRGALPFVDRQVTEITCHALGAHYLKPGARTVIDIGGQDSKAIKVDSEGRSVDFVMNDKCAAGTGRFMEVMARALELDITNLAELSNQSTHPASVGSMCTVFAESEVVALVAESVPVADIVAGLHSAIAERVAVMVSRIGIEPTVVMTGGVALNGGVVQALERKLECRIVVAPDPQLVGALGAALLAGRWATGANGG